MKIDLTLHSFLYRDAQNAAYDLMRMLIDRANKLIFESQCHILIIAGEIIGGLQWIVKTFVALSAEVNFNKSRSQAGNAAIWILRDMPNVLLAQHYNAHKTAIIY